MKVRNMLLAVSMLAGMAGVSHADLRGDVIRRAQQMIAAYPEIDGSKTGFDNLETLVNNQARVVKSILDNPGVNTEWGRAVCADVVFNQSPAQKQQMRDMQNHAAAFYITVGSAYFAAKDDYDRRPRERTAEIDQFIHDMYGGDNHYTLVMNDMGGAQTGRLLSSMSQRDAWCNQVLSR